MSIIHVVGGSGGGTLTDRTPFFGVRVPEEVKGMAKCLKQMDKATLRKMLQVTVGYLEGKTVDYTQFQELESGDLTEETVAIIYSGLLKLLRMALRIPQTSLKQEYFKEDLLDIKIPEDFIPDIASVVFGSRRPCIDTNAMNCRPQLPKLDLLRWRVDVGISTSVLNRVLEPTVMMQMTLSDGRRHSFEVPIAKFHELRYNVSSVLKEMEDLEKRSILKIQD